MSFSQSKENKSQTVPLSRLFVFSGNSPKVEQKQKRLFHVEKIQQSVSAHCLWWDSQRRRHRRAERSPVHEQPASCCRCCCGFSGCRSELRQTEHCGKQSSLTGFNTQVALTMFVNSLNLRWRTVNPLWKQITPN